MKSGCLADYMQQTVRKFLQHLICIILILLTTLRVICVHVYAASVCSILKFPVIFILVQAHGLNYNNFLMLHYPHACLTFEQSLPSTSNNWALNLRKQQLSFGLSFRLTYRSSFNGTSIFVHNSHSAISLNKKRLGKIRKELLNLDPLALCELQ